LYLGDFYFAARHDPLAAATEYAIALDIFTGMLKTDPDNLDFQQRVAAVHYRLGVVAEKRAGLAAAIGPAFGVADASRHFAECLKTRESLAKIDTTDAQAKLELMLV